MHSLFDSLQGLGCGSTTYAVVVHLKAVLPTAPVTGMHLQQILHTLLCWLDMFCNHAEARLI